jgi:hypothetical protein
VKNAQSVRRTSRARASGAPDTRTPLFLYTVTSTARSHTADNLREPGLSVQEMYLSLPTHGWCVLPRLGECGSVAPPPARTDLWYSPVQPLLGLPDVLHSLCPLRFAPTRTASEPAMKGREDAMRRSGLKGDQKRSRDPVPKPQVKAG